MLTSLWSFQGTIPTAAAQTAAPLAATVVASAIHVPTATSTSYVTTANLSIRTGHSTSYARITVLPRGTLVVPTGAKWGAWWQVTAAGHTGWVSSTYIRSTSTSTTSYRWPTYNVNVRTGPGSKYRSYGVISAWERVVYYRTSGGWSYVQTRRGTKGWISNTYLSTHGKYDVAVYGTLRKGQSAYFLVKGKTVSERRTTALDHALYLRADKTWWSYMVPNSYSRKVVIERMKFKNSLHSPTLANMDEWERYNPDKPLDTQNYNRRLVRDASGARVWAYVASKSMASYMKKSGVLVASGDYLNRY